jgi:hypothetical protein
MCAPASSWLAISIVLTAQLPCGSLFGAADLPQYSPESPRLATNSVLIDVHDADKAARPGRGDAGRQRS